MGTTATAAPTSNQTAVLQMSAQLNSTLTTSLGIVCAAAAFYIKYQFESLKDEEASLPHGWDPRPTNLGSNEIAILYCKG